MPSRNEPGFIVAFNRDRDGYQFPLALAEAGMLRGFITDFYASAWSKKLIPRLNHRIKKGISGSLVTTSAKAFFLQIFGPKLKMNFDRMWIAIDTAIATKAAQVACRSDADLFLYSQFALESFTHPKLQNRRRGLFMYHPHRTLIREVLLEDLKQFPIPWAVQDFDMPAAFGEREDRELERAQVVLCASSFTRASLIHHGVPAEKIKVVPYGMAESTHKARIEKGKAECRFLFVGQGVQRKGLHHLLLAWNKLALPNAHLTLVCYRIDPAIASLVGPNVEVRSQLSQADLDQVFAETHVFAMPSLIEGFGLVFLEALAAGCYIIGSRNTGLPDLPVSEDLATLITPGDVDGIAAALEDACKRHHAGGLPHDEIAAFSQRWTWDQFREGVRRETRAFIESTPRG